MIGENWSDSERCQGKVMEICSCLCCATASSAIDMRQGAPWSWKVVEFRKTIFQAWKVMENSKCHGMSWKMMILSWNVYCCTEQFCKSDTTSFIKSSYEP